MEPLPAGARVPPPPLRPPAPPATGWMGRPAGPPGGPAWWSELRKVAWPTRAALGHDTGLVLLVIVLLAGVQAGVGLLAGALLGG